MNPDLNAISRALDRLVASQQKGAWDYIATIAVVFTLIVLFWYTVETYKLRKAAQAQTTETEKLLREAQLQNKTSLRLVEHAQRQNDATVNLVSEAQRQNEATANLVRAAQRQNETSVMPVLSIRVGPPETRFGPSRKDWTPILVLTNEGTGPAFNVSIESYVAESRELTFDQGNRFIRPGEERELNFHLEEGHNRTIGNVDELYHWIKIGQLPDPLCIPVRCVSASSTHYTFVFRFTPIAGNLAVLLDDRSEPGSGR